ncbi:hypothetical protein J2Z62_000148 [Mycoplasmoides fastidiosum]|uniref:Uncharacterized protein n=1 Tax=Mycoplasmoides fastidiosum TaxID=92758 RepID=A0ABU0LYE6_9BACT|nr:hypothetical protein [Mycoplasmoides fastidiosum]MDQ0513710.1 hypothetical protein [Mycoplasmoides fastidiosum]UUD37867.1 hypothetical protein NPA10_00520 [Mycoplasmoides fastidiosum]
MNNQTKDTQTTNNTNQKLVEPKQSNNVAATNSPKPVKAAQRVVNKIDEVAKKKVLAPKKITVTKTKDRTSKPKSSTKKFFQRFGKLVVGFGAIALIPLITLAARDNDPYNTNLFREITSEHVRNNTEYQDLPKVNVSYGELIRGTRSYNNGNYVLYFGTEACSHCAEFLFSNANFSQGTPPLGNASNNASWSRGIWGQGITYADNISNPSVKFIMFEDQPPASQDAYSDRLFTLPWSTNQNNSLNSGIVAGQYVRNDQSALDFRALFSFAKANYSQVIGTPSVMAFRNGIFHWYNLTETTNSSGDNNQTPPTPEVNTAGTASKFIDFLNSVYNSNS